ncbi:hypothetical protein NEF87_001093 [Candidatus Lokiarchaeum ossiferum]|uniref:EamA domain-containing protein n=1 Tax=Candidatus Lokiarchaeum ossiferum TaxID=2951803 RepID=A0ABY6HNC7_9ARCH|nr:hypothetical protein NEF87_001093 [Candidatus Lokiarchaeum sp. B-35]
MKTHTKGILAATFNYTFIGLSFLFTKISVAVAPVFIVLSLRFVISLIILLLFSILSHTHFSIKESLKKDWKLIGIFSLLQPILFFIFQAYALNRVDSTEVGLISSTSPALVALLGFIILKESLSTRKIIGLICSLGGLLFIYIMKGALAHPTDIWGIMFIISATLTGALYQVLARKLSKHHDPYTLTFIRISIGTIIFSLISLTSRNWQVFSFSELQEPIQFYLGLFYLALFTTVGTSILTIIGLKHLKAAEQGIFAGLATTISILAGILILSESFYWYQIIGAIFTILGIYLMNSASQEKEVIC